VIRFSQLNAVLLILGLAAITAQANPKISKVLPHWLDKQGRHTLSPSLFERDAYQAQLRTNPDQRSGIRFDVKWAKGSQRASANLNLQVELQTSATTEPVIIQQPLKTTRRGGWAALKLDGERYKAIGKIIAWRARLLDGDKTLAERRSFLWPREKASKKPAKPAVD
jgi:hypothetical protein